MPLRQFFLLVLVLLAGWSGSPAQASMTTKEALDTCLRRTEPTRYMEAIRTLEEDAASNPGPENSTRWFTLSLAANCYREFGHPEEGAELDRRTLTEMEGQWGPDDIRLAKALRKLAFTYQLMYRYDEAEALYLRALAITEKMQGGTHIEVASLLLSLGELYNRAERHQEAEATLDNSLVIMEAALGPEHNDLAVAFDGLATVYEATGRNSEAEAALVRALMLRETSVGPESTAVAKSLDLLGSFYQRQGRIEKAMPLHQRALAIYQEPKDPPRTGGRAGFDLNSSLFPKGDPAVAISLNYIGGIHLAQKRYEEAEPLLRKSLAILEASILADTRTVVPILENLQRLYVAQGRGVEAEKIGTRLSSIADERAARRAAAAQ
jgi:tetratricopeptide (TPR) repeat protein